MLCIGGLRSCFVQDRMRCAGHFVMKNQKKKTTTTKRTKKKILLTTCKSLTQSWIDNGCFREDEMR